MKRITTRAKTWDGSIGEALLADFDFETKEIYEGRGYSDWALLSFPDGLDGDELQEILERLAYYEDKAEQEGRERGDNN